MRTPLALALVVATCFAVYVGQRSMTGYAGDTCCPKAAPAAEAAAAAAPASCSGEGKLTQLLAEWKTTLVSLETGCPTKRAEVAGRIAAIEADCPIGSRMVETLTFTRDVLAKSVAADPACAHPSAGPAREGCVAGDAGTVGTRTGDAKPGGCEATRLLETRSAMARGLETLASYAVKGIEGTATAKKGDCSGFGSAATTSASAAAAATGACAKTEVAVTSAEGCAKSHASATEVAVKTGVSCAKTHVAVTSAEGCAKSHAPATEVAVKTGVSCAKTHAAVTSAEGCAKSQASATEVAVTGGQACAKTQMATAGCAGKGACAEKCCAEKGCCGGEGPACAGCPHQEACSQGACAEKCAAGGCPKAKAFETAAADCQKRASCPKALMARGAALKASWEKVPGEYTSLSAEKKREVLTSMESVRKDSRVMDLLPATVLALADGVERLDGVHAKIRDYVKAHPAVHQGLPAETVTAFEDQASLVREAAQVLARVKAGLAALLQTQNQPPEAVVLQQ